MPQRNIAALRSNNSASIKRPRTSPGFTAKSRMGRHVSVQIALSPEDRAIPEEDEDDVEEEKIELLEYEWPDLPPIPCMKDAVSRKRVSRGISYLLPVDKGKNSINNCFRTDLRAMFQEPYASDDLQYDDNRVKLSAEIHFLSNTADTKWTHQHLKSLNPSLNAESEKARKLYVHSAPTGGVASRRVGIDPNKLRKRSNLFLPIKASKAQVSPEIIKLREEAAKIIKQGMAFNEDGEKLSQDGNDGGNNNNSFKRNNNYNINNINNNEEGTGDYPAGPSLHPRDTSTNFLPRRDTNANVTFHRCQNNSQQIDKRNNNTNVSYRKPSLSNILENNHRPSTTIGEHRNMLSTFGGSTLNDSLGTSTLNEKLKNVNIHQQRFSNYEDFQNSSPPKPVIPREFTSPFLDSSENQRVWEWLHHGESMDKFQYFLSVCG